MSSRRITILNEPDVRESVNQAWHDSQPKGVGYVGEFVVSQWTIYLIAPDGIVSEFAATGEIVS